MVWLWIFLILAILFGGLGYGLAIMALRALFYVFLALFVACLIGRAARHV